MGNILHPKYDNIFRTIISSGWGVKSDGDVESPTGAFAVVEIPPVGPERRDMADACDLGWDHEDWPDTGWYLVIENDQGLVFVYPQRDQTRALAMYGHTLHEYERWANS